MGYYLISIVIAYLLGSISPSVILGKYLYHHDLRNYGSNNPGTANSVYVYGFFPGLIVLLVDILKGAAALWIADMFIMNRVADPLLLLLITAFFAIIGHCFSIFLKFKGGKGFATFVGVSFYLFPLSSLLLLPIYLLVVLASKYISIGTFTVAILSPAIQIYLHYRDQTYSKWSWLVLAAISLLVIFEHRENVIKLIKGKEISIKNPRIKEDEFKTGD